MRAGFWQIVIVLVLVLILFGHNKIPEMMKNLASGINTFKKELKDDGKDTGAQKKDVKAKKAVKSVATKKVAKKSGRVSKKKK